LFLGFDSSTVFINRWDFSKGADGIHVLVSFLILTSRFSSLSEKFSLCNVLGRGIERLAKGYKKPEDCLKNRSSTKAVGMDQKLLNLLDILCLKIQEKNNKGGSGYAIRRGKDGGLADFRSCGRTLEICLGSGEGDGGRERGNLALWEDRET
jgi:hypothetical protein